MKDGELLQKLKELTYAGYIETGQLERIEKEYFKEEPHEKKLMLSFALLGVLFVGIGLISICAFNWNELPQIARLIIAFVPFIGAQGLLCWQYKREASRIWIESLCLGVGLSFLLAIGLIYQVYQLSIGLDMIFLITFLAMLPVIYCCEAYYLSVLCLSGVVLYSLLEGVAFYNILVVLMLPHYRKCLRNKGQGTGLLTLGLIIWLIEFLYFTFDYFDMNSLISFMLLFILLTRIKCHPLFRKVGMGAFYLLNFFIVISQSFFTFDNGMQLLPIGILALLLGIRVYTSRETDKTIETGILSLQPILVGLGAVTDSGVILVLLFNIYMIGSILYLLLIKGCQEKSLYKLRLGTGLICIYALFRLFSADVALLAKGVGFIIVGIALLGANLWLNHLVGRGQHE